MGNTFGRRVRMLRRKSKMTQLDLAYRVFVSESYIALIEADKRNPSMEIVAKLADIFHVTADFLLNGEETEEDKLMLKEWSELLKNRTQQERDSALEIVKAFFQCVDNSKK